MTCESFAPARPPETCCRRGFVKGINKEEIPGSWELLRQGNHRSTGHKEDLRKEAKCNRHTPANDSRTGNRKRYGNGHAVTSAPTPARSRSAARGSPHPRIPSSRGGL